MVFTEVSSPLRPKSILSAILVGIALTVLAMPSAFAISPEKKFRGKIIVSAKRFPSRFDSDKAMIKHMKKVNTHEITASSEKDWDFEYMAFLSKPIGTLQAAVSFYDVTGGGQQLIDTFTFYPEDQSDKIIAGNQRLSSNRFSADRKYLMVFSRGYGQAALAKTKIVLRRK